MCKQRTIPVLLVVLLTWMLWGSASAIAQEEEPAPDVEGAQRHLRAGATLFYERNYEGALAEYEASFARVPSASAMQNVAICQSKLFRYVEAMDTLEQLRARFGPSLSKEEVESVEKALRNLSQFIGTLTLRIAPPTAAVTINGNRLSREEVSHPIKLSSGSHRIEVTADGHIPLAQTVKLAGSESLAFSAELRKAVGRLSVELNDDDAVVEMDGKPLGRGGWEGDVPAGAHALSVFKPGHATITTRVVVRTGEQMDLELAVGPEQEGVADAPDYVVAELPLRQGMKRSSSDTGWYATIAASNLLVLRSPDGFKATGGGSRSGGGHFGLTGGYRVYHYLALELMYEGGSHSVLGKFDDRPEMYDLLAHRAGANVRFYLGGKSFRFTTALGAGIVSHRLNLADQKFKGINSYFAFDIGPQLNAGRLLLDVVFKTYLAGADALRHDNQRAYTQQTVLPVVGVGLRVGYGQWGKW